MSTASSDTIPAGNVFYQAPAGGSAAEPGSPINLSVSSGPPPAITCAGLIQEAETGVLLEGFEVGDDPAASGGQYVAVPEGFGSNFQLEGNGSQARYCFTIAEAGTYRIKGNIHGNGNSNSLFVQVDGLPTEGYNWVFPTNTEYLEDYVNGLGIDPIEVFLDTGDHFVTVTLREDGARLDKLELELLATVPDVVGLSQVDAEAAIVAAGLTVGTVSTANSDTIPVGNVFYQTPAGGSAAEPGISVDLFVSSGPPPAITCAGLIQEAETGVLLEGFEVGDDPAAIDREGDWTEVLSQLSSAVLTCTVVG